jgi:hypothetical protein
MREQSLPYYFDPVNSAPVGPDGTGGTQKRAVLELKLFNHQAVDVHFKVGIYLYHGLFRPYLDYLANKASVEYLRAAR